MLTCLKTVAIPRALDYSDSLVGACCLSEANVETDQIACTWMCLKLPVDSAVGSSTFSGA